MKKRIKQNINNFPLKTKLNYINGFNCCVKGGKKNFSQASVWQKYQLNPEFIIRTSSHVHGNEVNLHIGE